MKAGSSPRTTWDRGFRSEKKRKPQKSKQELDSMTSCVQEDTLSSSNEILKLDLPQGTLITPTFVTDEAGPRCPGPVGSGLAARIQHLQGGLIYPQLSSVTRRSATVQRQATKPRNLPPPEMRKCTRTATSRSQRRQYANSASINTPV